MQITKENRHNTTERKQQEDSQELSNDTKQLNDFSVEREDPTNMTKRQFVLPQDITIKHKKNKLSSNITSKKQSPPEWDSVYQ